MGCLCWSNEEVAQGKTLKGKGMPKDCKRKLFRVLVSTHRTDYLVTNEVEPCDTAAAEQESSIRWTIEPFHRERKQLTGVQACQCRWPAANATTSPWPCGPGPASIKPRTRPKKRCISSNKGFWMRRCDTDYCSQPWLLRKFYDN